MKPNDITREIIGAAIDVHRELGPGQDEVLHEDAMEVAFHSRKLRFRRQPPLPVHYKEVKLDCGFRPDFVVEDTVVAESKAVELVHPVFAAQVRTYQRLGGWPLGLLLNFNVPVMKEGISRFIVNAAEFRGAPDSSTEVGRLQRKDDLLGAIIGAAIAVHRILGAGLLNSVYSACLQHELSLAGLKFETGRRADVFFQETRLGHPGELGLVVAGRALVSVLSVPKVLPVHEAQARSAMRLGGLPAGLILNFHAKRLADDLKRIGALKTSVSSKPLR
jgi:GxxExxY protein